MAIRPNFATAFSSENRMTVLPGNKKHRLRCAQHCCNDDQQSQYKNRDFVPGRFEIPENFITKLDILITL